MTSVLHSFRIFIQIKFDIFYYHGNEQGIVQVVQIWFNLEILLHFHASA